MKISTSNPPLAMMLLCLVALGGLYALFRSLSYKALDTASRVSEALEEWERKGLPGTVTWQAQVFLARQYWLGPFRPMTPENPLTACGVMVAGSCQNFPLTATNPGQLLSCLEEKMQQAEKDNVAFQDILSYSLSLIICAVTLGVMVLLRCSTRQGGSTWEDSQDTTPSEAKEIDTDCHDLSSDEYEDCQEYHAEDSQECTEDVVCGITNDSHDLSSEDLKDCTEDNTVQHPESCQEDVANDASVMPNRKKKKSRRKKIVKVDSVQDGGHKQSADIDNKERKKPSHDEEKEFILREKDRNNKEKKRDNKEKTWSDIVKDRKKGEGKCPKPSSGASQRPGIEQPPKGCHVRGLAKAACMDASREAMRDQWREAAVQVLLDVPPNRRRHVIGHRGETVRLLRRTYPEVTVTVPLPSDPTSGHVALEGPKGQVAAAADCIRARLKAAEEQILEEKRRRKENKPVTALVEVEPNMRGVVVGPGGERLQRLAQEHPLVRVTLPPPTNTNTHTATLRGPPNEVAAVKASLEAFLQEERRRRKARAARVPRFRRAPRSK